MCVQNVLYTKVKYEMNREQRKELTIKFEGILNRVKKPKLITVIIMLADTW